MKEQFFRSQMLLGEAAMERLYGAKVAVFGIGGVGGYTVEALARAGVGELHLIDSDTVGVSNLNRQLIATHSNLGKLKVDAAKERILDINPGAKVVTYPVFFNRDTALTIPLGEFDYIVDAIDSVSCKLLLIEMAFAAAVPIISCMGTGNKLDASAFQVADISRTAMCPLARVMRKELGKRGIKHMKVVYSREEAMTPRGAEEEMQMLGKRQIPGSLSWVPGAAGLILAGEVIRDLAKV